MVAFQFVTEGVEIGFSDNFFAFGQSELFSFDDGGEYPGHPVPSIRGMKLNWRIEEDLNPWAEYEAIRSACREPITNRGSEIRELFEHPSGWMWVPEADRVSLSVRAPKSPGFQTFISGLALGRAELNFWCSGIYFADKKSAPAPTVAEFLKEQEPLFFQETPIFKLSRREN